MRTGGFIPALDVNTHVLRVADKRLSASVGTATGKEGSESIARKRRWRILVVDDEDLFREGLAFKLQTIYDAAVEEAETGVAALERVSVGSDFDLILMDVSLPDINGDMAYQTLRARGVDTPIVLMSAHEENRAVAQALGIPFLDKPLDDAALESILLGCGGESAS